MDRLGPQFLARDLRVRLIGVRFILDGLLLVLVVIVFVLLLVFLVSHPVLGLDEWTLSKLELTLAQQQNTDVAVDARRSEDIKRAAQGQRSTIGRSRQSSEWWNRLQPSETRRTSDRSASRCKD